MTAMKKIIRLTDYFEPDNYKVTIETDIDSLSFYGELELTGKKIGKPSKRITLHQKNLSIKSVKLTYIDKKGLEEDRPVVRINTIKNRDELRIHSDQLLLPGSYRINITYSGQINTQMHGIYVCNYTDNNEPRKLIATQFESHHAREAMPCIDEPAAKATFDLTLLSSYPENLSNCSVIANHTKNGKTITRFETTPIMSTYLLAFVSGDLSHRSTSSASGVSINAYATPPNARMLDYCLNVAVQCLDYFEDYFNVKYPLAKLDLVALPDFSAGAMENWGLMTFRESCMLVDPSDSSIETKQFVAIIVAHEISHQWFGNLVTMDWWDDLWLNESFASLMEYLAVDHIFPQWRIFDQFISHDILSALYRDSLPNVQPVVTDVMHPDEINTIFDPSIVYAKGAALLYMLMNYLGHDEFRSGIRKYIHKFAYKNTKAADLWEALGDEVAKFMTAWLLRPGYPVVSVDFHQNKLVLTQERLVMGTATENHDPWPIPLSAKPQLSTEIMTSKKLETEVQADKSLLINTGCKGYFVTHYQSRNHLTSLLNLAGQGELDMIDRLMLLQNAALLERNGKINTWEALEQTSYYKNEKEEPVWSAIRSILATARKLLRGSPAESLLKDFSKDLTLSLVDYVGWDKSGSDSPQILRLRGSALSSAAWSGNLSVRDEGLRRFALFNQPSDISSDIRTTIYFIGVRYGSRADFNKLLKLYRQSSIAEDKEDLLSGLSSTTDEECAELMLKMAVDGEIKPQDVTSVFAQLLANPFTTKAAWSWLKTNWHWIEKTFGGDKSYDSYPRIAGSMFSKPTEKTEYDNFFGPMQKRPALSRAISLGLEEISANLIWRQKNETITSKWLKQRTTKLQ